MENDLIRPIPFLDGYYATSFGSIYSVWSNKFLKIDKKVNNAGYFGFQGSFKSQKGKRGRQKKYLDVHRAVCMAFYGVPKDKTMQVNHKNGDKKDNKVSNLEWVTPKQNIKHMIDNGMFEPYKLKMSERNKGSKNIKAKLSENDVEKIRELHKTGSFFQREIGKMFGVSQTIVSGIILGKIWKKNLIVDN